MNRDERCGLQIEHDEDEAEEGGDKHPKDEVFSREHGGQ